MDNIHRIKHNAPGTLLVIAGPCVVESRDMVFRAAETIKIVSDKLQIPVIFKSSYRKANRSKIDSFTGIGDDKALEILKETSEKYDIPVTTDIHLPSEASHVAGFVDILQIPAFLCRQTDLLVSAAETGKWVNIKKGQFLSGSSMKYAVEKVRSCGNENIMLTERGNMFGYQDLVVDMRNIPELRKNNVPVIMDITHSLQLPNQPDGIAGGLPGMIETIGMASVAAGADGVFIETHPDPGSALSDGANMLHLDKFETLIRKLVDLKNCLISINQK